MYCIRWERSSIKEAERLDLRSGAPALAMEALRRSLGFDQGSDPPPPSHGQIHCEDSSAALSSSLVIVDRVGAPPVLEELPSRTEGIPWQIRILYSVFFWRFFIMYIVQANTCQNSKLEGDYGCVWLKKLLLGLDFGLVRDRICQDFA